MSEKISVIVPVYKVEDYLDDCVRSIVSQTYSNLEIVLVDDGSPDRCPVICDQWEHRDGRIKVIHKNNGGLSDARNAGLEICTGSFIAFVDSDDWIHPKMYERMMEALLAENADLCACSITDCYPDRMERWGCRNDTAGDSETMLRMLYSDASFPVCAWNKLYRRNLWEEIRFPEGKICEDAFTTYQLVHKASRIVQLAEPLYYYRIRPDSIMNSGFSRQRMDEEEAWRLNCDFIADNYPSLYNLAFTFYLQKVSIIARSIPQEQRETYREEYDYLQKVLSDNTGFMLFRSTASMKYKARYLLDCVLR